MLQEEEKKHYEKNIKIYNLLSKCSIPLIFIPMGFLLYKMYIQISNETAIFSDELAIITAIIFFVVIWGGYMSFNIKKDILKDILEASEKESETKKEW